MAKTKEVLEVATALKQALAPLPDAVAAIGTAVDALEATITEALANLKIPAADQKNIDDAFATLTETVASAASVADAISKVRADATDNRDEASVLAASYPDDASFQAAVLAYRGGFIVNQNGVTVKGGVQPALEYATDAGGSVNLVV